MASPMIIILKHLSCYIIRINHSEVCRFPHIGTDPVQRLASPLQLMHDIKCGNAKHIDSIASSNVEYL